MVDTKQNEPITLKRVVSELPLQFSPRDVPETPITGIAIDNRRVEKGNLFVALKGGSADGHDYIPDAISRGAAAIVGEEPLELAGIPYIRVENSRQALTWLAAAYHGNPARKLTVIGVTGTDGKTTTCNLLTGSCWFQG